MSRLILASPFLAASILVAGSSAKAQAISKSPAALAGSYRCMSYNVSGRGGSCASFPRLILNQDGSYQYSSTRGSWDSNQGVLHLSDSKLWGPGTIVDDRTVRFEYDYRGWHHVVTWVCQGSCQDAQSSAAAGPSTRSSLQPVGVTLTLQFEQSIGGVSGFVIVPAEVARGFQHNDPLPAGAVMGLAWETGANAVRLSTNRDNRLSAGREYVVFLSWPRESIPVALLDLPSGPDFVGTLQGTLDGASVLARIRP